MTDPFSTRRKFLRTVILGGAIAPTVPSFVNSTFAALGGVGAVPVGDKSIDYVHPAAMPLTEVVKQVGNKRLASLGYIDVTATPFDADSSGKKDCTKALQAALDFARNNQMVSFFPPGTYLVSDTINLAQGFVRNEQGAVIEAGGYPYVLHGSRIGASRPVIVLAPSSSGFDNPGNPRPVVYFWKRANKNPEKQSTASEYRQMLVNIDVRIGKGNPGAIGIHAAGAEGCGVQDCTVYAGDGHCGIRGAAGGGGSHAGVTVIGGTIGMDCTITHRTPTLTGIRLINQKRTALIAAARPTLTIVGCEIETAGEGPAVQTVVVKATKGEFTSWLSLIDTSIRYTGRSPKTFTAVETVSSLYCRNLFVGRVGRAIALGDTKTLDGNTEGWLKVDEYAHAGPAYRFPDAYVHGEGSRDIEFAHPVYLAGVRGASPWIRISRDASPPARLAQSHLWPTNFPSFESPGAVVVTDPPYGAKGDGTTDDTAAIQKAIDENEIVFLPKGKFALYRTIRLKKDTKLIGLALSQNFSPLIVPAGADFFTPKALKPVIETADAADSDTIIAFVTVVPKNRDGYAVKWMCGGASVVRSPLFQLPVLVTGHGGGKWYNTHGHASYTSADSSCRNVFIDRTDGPIHFYHLSEQRSLGDANVSVIDAKNVFIYGLKSEGPSYALEVIRSTGILVTGFGGPSIGKMGSSLFTIRDCRDVTIANTGEEIKYLDGNRTKASGGVRVLGQGKKSETAVKLTDPAKWHMIIEEHGGQTFKTAPGDRPVMYKSAE